MSELRVVSYGGGVQSTALLVLAAQGRIDFQTFLMANVGDDSEHPETLDYVRQVAIPYAQANGLQIHLLDKVMVRTGRVETLYGRMTRPGSRSLPIPVRFASGTPVGRTCTGGFKVDVTGRWLKAHGASEGRRCKAHVQEDVTHVEGKRKDARLGARPRCQDCLQPVKATVALGISLDEIRRANLDRARIYERLTYPLIGIGEETGLRMSRADCLDLIADAGLPLPRKSSCYFCPYGTADSWAELERDHPDLYRKSCELEDHLSSVRTAAGREPVFLTGAGIPLREAFASQALAQADEDSGCDSGVCFT